MAKLTRSDREHRHQGPLSEEEIQWLSGRGLHVTLWRHLATQWDQDSDVEAEAFAQALAQTPSAARKVEAADASLQDILGFVAAEGGRLRGELLRKAYLLRTLEDVTPHIQEALAQGLLVSIPSADQHDLTKDALFDQATYLQTDLALPQGVYAHLSGRPASQETWALERGAQGVRARAISGAHASLDALELNLLHLCDALNAEPLRLNKSGAPNRRSLARFVEGILPPGEADPIGDLDAQDIAQLDYVAYLLALALALNMIQVQDQSARVEFEPMQAFFARPQDARHRALEGALQNLKAWNEVLSAKLDGDGAQEQDLDAQLSLLTTNGEWLISARGYVLSVLRRAKIGTQWVRLEDVVELCVDLDRDYLPRVLSGYSDAQPETYVRLCIQRLLGWSGLLESTTDEVTDEALIRLSERGHALIASQPHADAQGPCLVVQPNFEVMVFLDNAPTPVLFQLYQIATRVTLADRVVTFRLTSQSIQRGYALGMSVERTLAFLNASGHTPLDQTITFQLEDWARMWARVTLYASGVLLRHEDPDAFDLVVGQLKHEWRDRDIELLRLSPGAAFASHVDMDAFERMFTHNPSVVIDYLGHIPACLDFTQGLHFTLRPALCDIITFEEIDSVAQRLPEQGTRLQWHYTLDLDAAAKRWPQDTLEHLLGWLRPRAIGGLGAAQELILRSRLDKAPQAGVREDLLVVHFESAHISELFAQVPRAQDLIEARLGPLSFGVPLDREDDLDQLLDHPHIRATSTFP